jgi:hypothetical protein
VFAERYALSPYIKQIRFVFKGLNTRHSEGYLREKFVSVSRIQNYVPYKGLEKGKISRNDDKMGI